MPTSSSLSRVKISHRSTSLIRSILRPFLRPALQAYRTSDFKWRYVDNFSSSLAYQFGRERPAISREAARILSELNQNGVAITSAEALFGADPIYGELVDAVGKMETDLSYEIEAARAKADDIDPLISKTYVYFLCGRMKRPIFDPKDVLIRLPLSKPILEIVNAYYQMYTRLCMVNIWHTFPTRNAPRKSQLWHHDPEDRYILKVFVYLSDVDKNAGPFTYAGGTHPKGMPPKADFLVETGRERVKVNDAQMATVVPVDKWVELSQGRTRAPGRARYVSMYICLGSIAASLRCIFGWEPYGTQQSTALRFGYSQSTRQPTQSSRFPPGKIAACASH
jgi:hypothetical protein